MNQPSIRIAGRSVAGLVLVAVLAAACSAAATTAPTQPPAASTPPAASAPAASAPAASAAAGGLVVNMATTALGPVLVGTNGLTLYTHAGDSATASTCTGGCAAAWPPLAVPTGSAATGGTGVTGAFATLTRDDGTLQVTYKGLPLYGWKNDAKAGDTTGQGVNGFTVAAP
jgi:predicted lipoprotein with Yx(FWY)xxD motif